MKMKWFAMHKRARNAARSCEHINIVVVRRRRCWANSLAMAMILDEDSRNSFKSIDSRRKMKRFSVLHEYRTQMMAQLIFLIESTK